MRDAVELLKVLLSRLWFAVVGLITLGFPGAALYVLVAPHVEYYEALLWILLFASIWISFTFWQGVRAIHPDLRKLTDRALEIGRYRPRDARDDC